MKNPYDVLGIKRNSTEKEIKKAWKAKSKKHHPDTGGNEEDFHEVQKAYELLNNSELRLGLQLFGEEVNLDEMKKIMGTFQKDLLAILFNCVIDRKDPFKILANEYDKKIALCGAEITAGKQFKRTCEKAQQLLETDLKENFVAKWIESSIIQAEQDTALQIQQIEIYNRLIAITDQFRFRKEMPASGFVSTSSCMNTNSLFNVAGIFSS